MKIVVLGAGLMGKEAVRDLIQNDQVEKVYLADIQTEQAEAFVKALQTDKVEVEFLNAQDEQQLQQIIQQGDVVINALFYTFNETVAKTAIALGVHYVDLGGHIGGATDKVLALNEAAQEKQVTLIPDLGVAPGMMNILAGYGKEKFDKLDTLKIFVGGVPAKPIPPLNYQVVFSLDGVFDHYTDPSTIIRNGQKETLASLSEIEEVTFEKKGNFEAFHTSGGTSTLIDTFSDIDALEYKTVRYPGHAEKFKLLVDLGLLDKNAIAQVDGEDISVRKVMREHLGKQLSLGDGRDMVLLQVNLTGTIGKEPKTIRYELVTEKDDTLNITAMARVTASTISIVAQMIASGEITKRGAFPPECIVDGKQYIEALDKRGMHVIETVLPSTKND